MSKLNKKVINNFWQNKSIQNSSRWTNKSLLEFEVSFLTGVLPVRPITILDLGSGSGDLSKAIKRPDDRLIAVDSQENFKKFFNFDKAEFVNCDVTEFVFMEKIDLILFFGVINYLSNYEIIQVLTNIATLNNPNLQLIIKAQFALKEEHVINKFSQELDHYYSARYLHFDSFLKVLEIFTEKYEIIEYPPEFNIRENFVHIAIRIYDW